HMHLTLTAASSPFDHLAPPALSCLSLHDALPISRATSAIRSAVRDSAEPSTPSSSRRWATPSARESICSRTCAPTPRWPPARARSEEHTSELQSPYDLVCRLLLEKKHTGTILILW